MSKEKVDQQNNLVKPKNVKNRDLTCSVCRTIFATKADLETHSLIHSGPFSCDGSEKFYVKTDLEQHYRNHNTEKLYRCELCKKNYTGSQAFTDHLCVRTEEKPYLCDICAEHFGSKDLLDSHTQIHAVKKHFICEICKKHFKRKEILNNHVCVQVKEKRYPCNKCERKFSDLSSLKTHCLIHEEEKSGMTEDNPEKKSPDEEVEKVYAMNVIFVCDICNKCFSALNTLNQHQLIHSVEKPYVCKEFNREINQTVHSEEQTNSFTCGVCRKKFAMYNHLKRHYLIHTNNRPYARKTVKKSYS